MLMSILIEYSEETAFGELSGRIVPGSAKHLLLKGFAALFIYLLKAESLKFGISLKRQYSNSDKYILLIPVG